MQFLGVLNHQRGRNDIAIDPDEPVIAVEPRLPDSHNNLGNVLLREGSEQEAAAAYRAALAS